MASMQICISLIMHCKRQTEEPAIKYVILIKKSSKLNKSARKWAALGLYNECTGQEYIHLVYFYYNQSKAVLQPLTTKAGKWNDGLIFVR